MYCAHTLHMGLIIIMSLYNLALSMAYSLLLCDPHQPVTLLSCAGRPAVQLAAQSEVESSHLSSCSSSESGTAEVNKYAQEIINRTYYKFSDSKTLYITIAWMRHLCGPGHLQWSLLAQNSRKNQRTSNLS